MKKKKKDFHKLHNKRVEEMAEVNELLANVPPHIQEHVRETIQIEFGALMGIRFRLREQLGCEPHPTLIRAEMAKLFDTWKELL